MWKFRQGFLVGYLGILVSKETVPGDLFVILVEILFPSTIYMIVFATYPCCWTFSISLGQLLALFSRNACIKIPPNNLISKSQHNLGTYGHNLWGCNVKEDKWFSWIDVCRYPVFPRRQPLPVSHHWIHVFLKSISFHDQVPSIQPQYIL